MKLTSLQFIFSLNVSKLVAYMYMQGYTCSLGEAERTKEMAELYAKKGVGIIDSLHRKRLAIDLNLFKGGDYLPTTTAHMEFGAFWENLHPQNVWGGRWHDGNHYEMELTLERAKEKRHD
jgi:hypothetical protein